MPVLCPTLEGGYTAFAELPLQDGKCTTPHAVRLLTYLPGTPLSSAPKVCSQGMLRHSAGLAYISACKPVLLALPNSCWRRASLRPGCCDGPQSLGLFRAIGALLGRVDAALNTFSAPHLEHSSSPGVWDLRSAARVIAELLPRHTDAEERCSEDSL